MSDPLRSAVVSEAVSRATSFLTGKYSKHKNVHEWIERLLRVRIKIESVVKVSEEFDMNIKSLHEWQEKFKEDLREAEEALSNFPAEILHEEPNQTINEGGSSARGQSSPWPAIIKRLSEFARVLDPRTFSLQNPQMMINEYLENDEKVRKLIKTVEKLEKMASDIGDFIVLLKLQSKFHMSRKRKRKRKRKRIKRSARHHSQAM